MKPKYGYSAKSIELSTAFTGQQETLVCPNCGGKFLHQTSLASDVNNSSVKIAFDCEGCYRTPVLRMSQRDGSTILGWVEI